MVNDGSTIFIPDIVQSCQVELQNRLHVCICTCAYSHSETDELSCVLFNLYSSDIAQSPGLKFAYLLGDLRA